MKKGLLTVALSAAMTFAAALHGGALHAQRTMRGQHFLTASAAYTFTPGVPVGADMSFGGYGLSSYWEAGVFGMNRTNPLSLGGRMDDTQFAAYAGWMYRLASTRSRALSLYLGGGAFTGWEAFDLAGRMPAGIDTGLGRGKFLYGVLAKADLEVFLSDRTAFTFYGRFPLNFSSPCGWVRWDAGIGVRVLL